jgi:hypothetical protein
MRGLKAYAIGGYPTGKMEKSPPNSVADHGLDTELQDFSSSTATLSQALMSRQHLLIADVEEVCEKFEASLS